MPVRVPVPVPDPSLKRREADLLVVERVTRSARGTEAIGAALARALLRSKATCTVLLDGDLGAGKTTFVRGFVRALPGGAGVVVQSPTFALARTYPTTPPVHHLDLYRIDDAGALAALGLEDVIDGGGDGGGDDGFVLVEWAREFVGGVDPVRVRFTSTKTTRRLRIELPANLRAVARALARTP